MRVIRKTCLLVLLLVAVLFVQSASAMSILPNSSYAEAMGNWQGQKFYQDEDEGLDVKVEFAVYDTDNLLESDENVFVAAMEPLNLVGQYIYAYQIFSHPLSDGDVSSFSIFGADTDIDEAVINGINWQDDGQDGVEPSDGYFDSDESKVVWEFSWGILIPGKHSYVMVFASDFAPVKGDYEIKSYVEEGDLPSIPEPGTLALLSIGGAMLFSKRRKSVLTIKFYNRTSKG